MEGGSFTKEEYARNLRAKSSNDSLGMLLALEAKATTNPAKYDQSYQSVHNFIMRSLDRYKNQLVHILFPLFVHSYIELIERGFVDEAKTFFEKHKKEHQDEHSDHLIQLAGINSKEHLQQSAVIALFTKHKYSVRLDSFASDLLFSYIQDSQNGIALRILNNHVSFPVPIGDRILAPGSDLGFGATQSPVSPPSAYPVSGGSTSGGVSIGGAAAGSSAPALKWQIPEDDEHWPFSDMQSGRVEVGGAKRQKRESSPPPPPETPTGTQPSQRKIAFPPIRDKVKASIIRDLRSSVPLTSENLPSICMYTFFNTHKSLQCVDISRNASIAVAGFADSSVRCWDLSKRKEEQQSATRMDAGEDGSYRRLVGHSGPVYGVSVGLDTRYVLSCSEDATIRLWNTEIGSCLVAYKGHAYPIWDVTFSPFGYYFASASHDRTARLWSTDRINPLRVYAGHTSDVDVVKFHPNCNYLATGSSDHCVRLWDVQSGECTRLFKGHRKAVTALSFSPDGRICASADESGRIVLWDLASSRPMSYLAGPCENEAIHSLDFSVDGGMLAAGSHGCSVGVYDVQGALAKGPPTTSSMVIEGESKESEIAPIKSFGTKSTPVFITKFTRRNLLLAGGAFLA